MIHLIRFRDSPWGASKVTSNDPGKLLLRVLVGGLMLLHGIHKIVAGPAEIVALVTHYGWPASLAYGVYLGEVVGPVMMILGIYTRIGGLLVFLDMVIGVLLTRGGSIWALNIHGGWVIELEAFYGLGGLAVALLGGGAYSMGRGHWLN